MRSTELQYLLDRYLGIPLLALLGVVHVRRSLPTQIKRIGIISPTAIGDMVLSTGLFIHLREQFPGAELHIFHGASNAGALSLIAGKIFSHQCVFQKVRATLKEICGANLDILIDLTPWPRLTAIVAKLSGVVTVGFTSENQCRGAAFDIAVRHSSNVHETENLRRISNVFGACEEYKVQLRMANTPCDICLPYEKLVILHTSAGGRRNYARSWPLASWAELSRRLCAEGFRIGLTGTKNDEALAQAILSRVGVLPDRAFSLCGKLNLAGLATVLEKARLVVSVDTGVLHIASAVNARLIGLHGPSRSSRWGARNKGAASIDSPHPCSGYMSFGFEQHQRELEIMPRISVDAVYNLASRKLLESEFDLASAS